MITKAKKSAWEGSNQIKGTIFDEKYPQDFEILGWSRVRPVLPQGEKVPL